MRIDHVIYATSDLDAASARVQAALGVPAVAGGRHEGLGTHNRIVPLGGGYLELLAVADPQEASGSALGSALQARLAETGEGLLGWAVAVEDVEPVAARLGTSLSTIARAGMSAHLTGVEEALREPFLPFFISRSAGVPDPAGRGDAGGIGWLEVAGDRARLERWLGGARLPVRIVYGAPAVRALGVGQRELRTA
jgi:catechol 2,3-dioxygenase-like lactoylglutathione lyase family enzyme